MPDFIPPGLLDNIGTIGLLILGVWLIATGRLVTRREHDSALKAAREATLDVIHDRDEWRAESRIKDQQIEEKDVQLRAALEGANTTNAVLNAIAPRPPT